MTRIPSCRAARISGRPTPVVKLWRCRMSGTLVRQPPMQPLAPADDDAVIGLVTSRRVGNRVAKHRDAIVFVGARRDAVRIGRSNPHVVACRAQAPAQRFDVHLGAADAVGEIPAEQVQNLQGDEVTPERPGDRRLCGRRQSRPQRRDRRRPQRSASERATPPRDPSSAARRPAPVDEVCANGAECSGT